jgi:hypothetical protein
MEVSLLDKINITQEITKEEFEKTNIFPMKDFDSSLIHFIDINKKGYLYRIKNGIIQCYDIFNNWRTTRNDMQHFKNTDFQKINCE